MIPHFLSRERRFLLWFFTSGPGSEIQTEHSLLINEDRDYIVIGQDRIIIKRAKDPLKIKDWSGICPSIERLAFSETLPTEKDYILTGNIKTTKGSPGMLRVNYNVGSETFSENGNIIPENSEGISSVEFSLPVGAKWVSVYIVRTTDIGSFAAPTFYVTDVRLMFK